MEWYPSLFQDAAECSPQLVRDEDPNQNTNSGTMDVCRSIVSNSNLLKASTVPELVFWFGSSSASVTNMVSVENSKTVPGKHLASLPSGNACAS